MEARIIAIFCEIDDLIKSKNIKDDKQATMSTAEVMTLIVASGEYFGGNIQKARTYFIDQNYVKKILSPSQLNRRIHAISNELWMLIFNHLSQVFNYQNNSNEYIIDSFSVESCLLVRAPQRKLFKNKEYMGYKAMKKNYYVGLKVHMITSIDRKPISLAYSPASYHDVCALKHLSHSLPHGSTIYADKAYNNYQHEDTLLRTKSIKLLPIRKSNSKRQYSNERAQSIKIKHKNIETAFSALTTRFPKSIHAVTERGFKFKVFSLSLLMSFPASFSRSKLR